MNEVKIYIRGYVYMPTEAQTKQEAVNKFVETVWNTGINIDNIEVTSAELRDADGKAVCEPLPEYQRHAHWVVSSEGHYACSCCGHSSEKATTFCPACGALMGGSNKEVG